MQWMIRYTSSMFSGKMGQSFQFTEVTTPCLNCRWLYSSISTRFCTSVWPTVFIYFVTAGRVEPIQYPGYVTSVISCLASYHLSFNSTSHSLITLFVFLFDANQYLKLGNKSGDLNVCYQITLTEAPPTRIRFCPQKEFFSSFRPTVYKYQVTENASFQNESFQNALQRGEFRKRQLLIYTRTEENAGFRLKWCQKPINRFLDDVIHHILRMFCEECYRNSTV